MTEPTERNALITEALLVMERGFLTSWITVEWSGGGQGFGGYVLARDETPSAHCGVWIRGVLAAAGVESWSDLKGKVVRIRHTPEKVHSIGHPIKDDRWFTPSEAFTALQHTNGGST